MTQPPPSFRLRRAAVCLAASFMVAMPQWAATEAGSSMPAATRKHPPNILLIVTDDQRWDTMGVMPTVRRQIGRRGARFRNAYVTSPTCCPSRASMLTGLLPRHTGVWANSGEQGGFAAFDDTSTLATWLEDAGYRTAMVGKYMNGYDPRSRYVPPGWDRWFAMTGGYHQWRAFDAAGRVGSVTRGEGTPKDHATRVVTREARSFIDTTDPGAPFFVLASYKAPHAPFTPDPRDVGSLDGIAPWRPASFNESDVGDKPAVLRKPRLGVEAIAHIDHARQAQLETLIGVDRGVRRLLRTLRAGGRLRDTIVVFVSDNGFLWGEHRWFGKSVSFEEAIRIPMYVRYDALFDGPVVVDRPSLQIDLAPTFVELAGLTPRQTDGASLVPSLLQTTPPDTRTFLVEHEPASKTRGYYCTVRDRSLSYTRHHDPEGSPIGEELYDLRVDPLQLRNTVADGDAAATLARMRAAYDLRCLSPAVG